MMFSFVNAVGMEPSCTGWASIVLQHRATTLQLKHCGAGNTVASADAYRSNHAVDIPTGQRNNHPAPTCRQTSSPRSDTISPPRSSFVSKK
ncbi:hypothetical protein [Herbaspirillum sp. YR522]|uniref:hypothetical protein n=1 Tax=Herbaspirillum sp. YR522 TaxID=1144342 RepID=UPI0012F787D4|nr:hypothetical protein [Herbaspirillum sp. YR522]